MALYHETNDQVWVTMTLLICGILIVDTATPEMLSLPELRQRHHLQYGICKTPLAISVCLESCMAKNAIEFAKITQFANFLVSYFSNVQPKTVKMAVNYCSSVQQWVDWTPSMEVFASQVTRMTQLYNYNIHNVFGPYGTDGTYTSLQPGTGVCLERVRTAMAQLPAGYQHLSVLFTSGRSSNPALTIQQAQAIMYGGAEIFAITELNSGVSDELRFSVSGPSYLLAVRDMNLLGKAELDQVIMNVCKIGRSKPSRRFPKTVARSLQSARTPSVFPRVLPLMAGRNIARRTSARNMTSMRLAISSASTLPIQASSSERSSKVSIQIAGVENKTNVPETFIAQPAVTEDFTFDNTSFEVVNATQGTFESGTTTTNTSSSEIITTLLLDATSFRNASFGIAAVEDPHPGNVTTENVNRTNSLQAGNLETTGENLQFRVVLPEVKYNEALQGHSGATAETRSGTSGDSCVDVNEISDPSLRLKILQDGKGCRDNASSTVSASESTPEQRCIDLTNVTHPLIRLDVILANMPRQPCPENGIVGDSNSTYIPQLEPQISLNDTDILDENDSPSTTQSSRICIDLNNVFDVYRLGVMLAEWSEQASSEDEEMTEPIPLNLPRFSNNPALETANNILTPAPVLGFLASTLRPQIPTSEKLCQGSSVVDDAGFNPAPDSCTAFVLCSHRSQDGTWTQHDIISCPAGLVWSQEKLTCVRPEDSTCMIASTLIPQIQASEGTLKATTTSEKLCQGSSVVDDAGFNPAPDSCTTFVLCSHRSQDGTWTQHDIISCPAGLVWSQEKLTCVRPEDSTCMIGSS